MAQPVEIFERPAGSQCDTSERFFGDRDRKAGLLAQRDIDVVLPLSELRQQGYTVEYLNGTTVCDEDIARDNQTDLLARAP